MCLNSEDEGTRGLFSLVVPNVWAGLTRKRSGDKVVLRFVVQGTHKAELEGIPPTGNKVVVSTFSIFRLKDGLIVEEIEDADMLGLYQQLGMELKPKEVKK